MVTAVWIIALCEIVRAIQNAMQLKMVSHDSAGRDNAYAEFVKSLHQTDKEFIRRLQEEIDKGSGDDGK